MMWQTTRLLFLSLVISTAPVLMGEREISAQEPQFLQQKRLIDKLFEAYERWDLVYIRTLVVPVPEILSEVDIFDVQLEKIVFPDVVFSHSFRVLGDPKIYVDRGEHGTKDIMADVEVCDRVLAYDSKRQQEYDKTFYLFYHFHFDRESGNFNVLAPIKPHFRESNCTP